MNSDESLPTHAELTLASILSSSFEAIIVTDNMTRITTFNEGAEKMFGYKCAEMLGQNIDTLIPHRFHGTHGDHIAQFSRQPAKSFKLGRLNEVMGLKSNGEEFPISASVNRIEVGENMIFSVIIRDMSELVEQDRTLRMAMKKAESATQAKSNFLATMSHEIRTPLHGILGMAQLLKRSITADTQGQYVTAIEDSGRTLLSLINDLLDLSRVEAGLMELENGYIDLHNFITDLLPGFQAQAQDKGLNLNVIIDEAIPETIVVDRLRLGQILTNLIGNAIKFTPEGQVTVRAEKDGTDNIRFSVEDTGIGMSVDEQKGIFERFSQSDESIQRKFGGSGLGLSIVNELVNLMSGTLGVESAPGKGSLFWVSIPISADEAQEDISTAPTIISDLEQIQNTRIGVGEGKLALVVDDVQTNRMVCTSILEELGYATIECDSGFSAITALNENPVDIIFMDLHMPNMSGDECIRAIRNSNSDYANTPIVVLTADASDEASQLIFSAGADEAFTKPFTLKQLESVSEKLNLADTESNSGPEPTHLILVDDDSNEFTLLNELVADLDANIQLDFFQSVQDFCNQSKTTDKSILLLDGNIPPISSHAESLRLIAESGCNADIYLLSADRYTKLVEMDGLNIVAALDKLEIQSANSLESFIHSAQKRFLSNTP